MSYCLACLHWHGAACLALIYTDGAGTRRCQCNGGGRCE